MPGPQTDQTEETVSEPTTGAENMYVAPTNRPRKVYSGMWGKAELIAVGISLLAILSVIGFYFFFVLPAQSKLETSKQESQKMEKELGPLQKFDTMEDSETEAVKLVKSVDDFELRALRAPSDGRSALYQRINALMARNNLVNTSGPDYAPLEIADPNRNQQTEEDSGRDKFQSLFPGEYITVTVEGSYQNLRRFISEAENSPEFLTITAIELVPSEREGKNTQDGTKETSPNDPNARFQETGGTRTVKPDRGKTRGKVVSLKIEMATYYRRPNFQPIAPVTEQ